MLRILLYFFFISTLFSNNLLAQFNDSIDYYAAINLAGNINHTTASTNYLLNNIAKFSIQKDKISLNTYNSWLYGENGGKLVNNDFTSSTDFNLYHKKKARFNYWGLVNYTSSYSLSLVAQFQGGGGLAYKLIAKEKIMLRVSDGLLYELSSIKTNGPSEQIYNTLRNSLRLQFRYKISDYFSFESAAYWQPSLNYKNDYIVNINAGLNIKLLKWLSFTSKFNYIQISRTQRENMLVTYGITVEQYF